MVRRYGNDRSWPIIIRYPTICPGLASDATQLLLFECFGRDATHRIVSSDEDVSSRTDGQTLGHETLRNESRFVASLCMCF